MIYELSKVLISEEKIRNRVRELVKEIQNDFGEKLPVLLPVLTGAFIFAADLIRQFSGSAEVQFIKASSYGAGMKSSGEVKITGLDDIKIQDKKVLIIEDIIDTGLTMTKLITELRNNFKPKEVRVLSLLDKPDRREYEIKADYVGFEIPDHFVVGYGLDYAQKYRGLPDIWTVQVRKNET